MSKKKFTEEVKEKFYKELLNENNYRKDLSRLVSEAKTNKVNEFRRRFFLNIKKVYQ